MSGFSLSNKDGSAWYNLKKYGKNVYLNINDTKTPFGFEKVGERLIFKFSLSDTDTETIETLERNIIEFIKSDPKLKEIYDGSNPSFEIKSGIRYNPSFNNLLITNIMTFKNKRLVKITNSPDNLGSVYSLETIPIKTNLNIKVKLSGITLKHEMIYFYYVLDEIII